MEIKHYPPYKFYGKTTSCYLTEKPNGENYMTNKQISFDEWDLVFEKELYDADILRWQESKTIVPVNKEYLDDFTMIIIEIYKPSKYTDFFFDKVLENGINISEASDRIIVEKKCDISLCCHCDGDCSQFYYEAKLLPVKRLIESQDKLFNEVFAIIQGSTSAELYEKCQKELQSKFIIKKR